MGEFSLGLNGIRSAIGLFFHDFGLEKFAFLLDLRAESDHFLSKPLVLVLDFFHGHFVIIDNAEFLFFVLLNFVQRVSVLFFVIEVQIVRDVTGGVIIGGFLNLFIRKKGNTFGS